MQKCTVDFYNLLTAVERKCVENCMAIKFNATKTQEVG